MKSENSDNSKRLLCTILAAIIVLSVYGVGILPVSANGASVSVTRILPDPGIVKTNEEFVVTLTQSDFLLNTGIVNEALPEGFTYVPGSLTGNASASYDETTNNLTIDFESELTVTYNVTASSYDQIPAEFSGTYKTLTPELDVEIGNVGGDMEVVVDGTPPYTEEHDPAPSATNVPIDTNITVHVKDNFMVNSSTIVMTMEGEPVTPEIILVDSLMNDFKVVYDPQENFSYGQVVDVTIDASDLAGNAMTTDAYSFTTVVEGLTGDVNNDGSVNVLDMIRVGQHWGETGTPGWIPEDIRKDGVINILDMIVIGQNWSG